MRRILNWQVIMGLAFIAISAMLFYAHYLLFRDSQYIFMYILAAAAFTFFEILLVTLVIQGLLNYREKKALLKKLNMVIGAFYSEVGTELMDLLLSFDHGSAKIAAQLLVSDKWPDRMFVDAGRAAMAYQSSIDDAAGSLGKLKTFLAGKRDFLLALLENPNLLEHDTFTNLLWAVFHLTEELVKRRSLANLSENDFQHLANDVRRVYGLLIVEWLSYMKHLKQSYPYLFSLAVRTNPFDPNAVAELK